MKLERPIRTAFVRWKVGILSLSLSLSLSLNTTQLNSFIPSLSSSSVFLVFSISAAIIPFFLPSPKKYRRCPSLSLSLSECVRTVGVCLYLDSPPASDARVDRSIIYLEFLLVLGATTQRQFWIKSCKAEEAPTIHKYYLDKIRHDATKRQNSTFLVCNLQSSHLKRASKDTLTLALCIWHQELNLDMIWVCIYS
jgi:hypothetical protein